MPVIDVSLRLIQKQKHEEAADLHPEVYRLVGNAYRGKMDRHFRSEMGFFPTDSQAGKALACALGEAIRDMSRDGDIAIVRKEMIALVDEVVAAAVRGLMLGEHRDG